MTDQEFNELLEKIENDSRLKRRFRSALGVDSRDREDAGSSRRKFDASGDASRFFPDLKSTAEEATEAIVGQIGEIQGAFNSLTSEIKENRRQSEEFFKAGFDEQYRKNLSSAISVASDMSYKLTGNLKASEQAITSLKRGFGQFALADKKMQDSISETATAFEAAGASSRDFAEIVESSTIGFGATTGQVRDLSAALLATGRVCDISKDVRGLRSFQKNLHTAKKTMDVFVKLQQMSRTTGVGFDALASPLVTIWTLFLAHSDRWATTKYWANLCSIV